MINSNNSGGHPITTVPLSEEAARTSQKIDAEFVDCRGLWQGFGIRRSLAYQLIADGAIKSVSLRRRGCVRGKRLFSVDSVRAYLTSQMEGERYPEKDSRTSPHGTLESS